MSSSDSEFFLYLQFALTYKYNQFTIVRQAFYISIPQGFQNSYSKHNLSRLWELFLNIYRILCSKSKELKIIILLLIFFTHIIIRLFTNLFCCSTIFLTSFIYTAHVLELIQEDLCLIKLRSLKFIEGYTVIGKKLVKSRLSYNTATVIVVKHKKKSEMKVKSESD